MLLDEATANIDIRTEKKIQKLIQSQINRNLLKVKTVIIKINMIEKIADCPNIERQVGLREAAKALQNKEGIEQEKRK